MRGLLKTNSDALNVVAHSHPDLGRKFPSYADEQDSLSDVDPVRLIDLLDNIDGLKREVQERMRRTEAVNQAKMLLKEDAIRSEALNRKLAELSRAFGEVRHEPSSGEPRSREAELLRMPLRGEPVAEISPIHLETFVRPQESDDWAQDENRELLPPADFLAFDPSPHDPGPHVDTPEQAQDLHTALHSDSTVSLTEKAPYVESDHALECREQPVDDAIDCSQLEVQESDESYRNVAQRFTDASMEKDQAIQAASLAKASYDNAVSQLELVKQAWIESNEALLNAKQLIEQSTVQLNLARNKEETAMADLRSAQQDLTTAYQFAAVAAQRQNDAAEFYRKSNRWTIHAIAISWMLLTWLAWLQFRAFVPIWAAAAASVLIVVLTVFIIRWSNHRE